MENRLLTAALKTFIENTGFQLEAEPYTCPDSNSEIDAVLKMDTGKTVFQFNAEIKAVISDAVIGFMQHQKKEIPGRRLLISNYVNPVMAEKLKSNDIHFMDAAGNAFINIPPVFIFIKGNKKEKTTADPSKGKAFTASGLKMVYALLCNERLVNKPYREIAGTAGIALGAVGPVIENLKQLGFIIDMGSRGKKLTNRQGLFKRWCLDYSEKLKTKLSLGVFKGPDDLINRYHLDPDPGLWGGETAAFELTKNIKPEYATIYTREENLTDLIIRYRLKKDENGNIEIFKTFWPIDARKEKNTVHPFIVYADLMETNNQRAIEAAKIIYEQNITGYFRES